MRKRLLGRYGAQPDAMADLDGRGGGGGELDDRKGTPRPGDSPRPDLSGDPQHTTLTVDEQNVDREAHQERVNGVTGRDDQGGVVKAGPPKQSTLARRRVDGGVNARNKRAMGRHLLECPEAVRLTKQRSEKHQRRTHGSGGLIRTSVSAHSMRQVSGLLLGTVLLLASASVPTAQRVVADFEQLTTDGATAIQERRYADALQMYSVAAKQRPTEPIAWLGAGVAAYMLGRDAVAETSLVAALRLNPRLVEAALLLGDLQYRGGRLREAIMTYEAAAKQSPKARGLDEKLEAWRREAGFADRLYESRGAHFRVLFDGPKDDALARRAVEMLESAYWRVGDKLTAYPPQTITVVLYTLQQFRDVTRAPAWAGGAYDGRIHIAVGGALERPDQLERMLAHEFTHAVVAMLGGRNVPLWLNEGLATALEPGGDEWAGDVLKANAARLPLPDLHAGFGRLAGAHVHIAYAQSAAAVKRLIELRGPSGIVALLEDLQNGVPFESAFHQRMAMRYDEFQTMMARR